MSYLFDPDNWEWLWTGNNARFILEGFLINLEIALVSMVFAMLFGLILALLRLSRVAPGEHRRRRLGRRVPQPAADLPDPLLRARHPRLVEGRVGGIRCPSGRRQAFQSGLVLGALMGLVLYNSAVLAEIMRAGILSLAARPGRGGVGAGHDLLAADALRDPAAGPAPDGARDRVAADHAQQGHDAGLDHRHHRGDAARPDRGLVELLRRSSRRRSCTSSSSSGSCS